MNLLIQIACFHHPEQAWVIFYTWRNLFESNKSKKGLYLQGMIFYRVRVWQKTLLIPSYSNARNKLFLIKYLRFLNVLKPITVCYGLARPIAWAKCLKMDQKLALNCEFCVKFKNNRLFDDRSTPALQVSISAIFLVLFLRNFKP